MLHSDQGGEFLSNELRVFCESNGIEQATTNSYSPQDNGIVQRANGAVLPRIRAALEVTDLPNLLWGEALLHVVNTLNKLQTKPLGMSSPHEMLYSAGACRATYVGCLVQTHIPVEFRTRKEKLSPRAAMGLLLGYRM
ncbi:hypothetical protein V7S43_019099 [Phytophthora oleae]|uniref:Integrase catalytic domain-containing protein n=1 Tax=Phytophthora oleae TaxID=2107226 RepID=A0ABD3FWB4_9STRA